MTRYAFILCFLLVGLASAQESRRSEFLDLRSLTSLSSEDGDISLELPLLASLGGIDCNDREGLEYDSFVDVLTEAVRALKLIDLDGDDFINCSYNGLLQVHSTEEGIARVRAFLQQIEQRMMRGLTVEVLELAPDELPAARLSAPEVTAYLRDHPPTDRARYRLRLGRRETLRAAKRTSVLADYDAEVAEKAKIAAPRVISFFEGRDSSIWVAARPDGRFQIDFSMRAAQRRGKFRLVKEVSQDIGTLELPHCSSQLLRTTADLAEGGAVVVGSTDQHGHVYMIRLVQVDDEPQLPSGMTILATDYLTRYLDHAPMPLIPQAGVSMNELGIGSDDRIGEPLNVIDREQFNELLNQQVIHADDDTGENQLFDFDRELWVIADAARRQRAREIVAKIGGPLSRTVDCELRWDMVDTDEFMAREAGNAADLAMSLENRILLSTRLGTAALAVSGKEFSYIRTKNVEIASTSQIANPVVDCGFSGVGFRFVPATTLSGDLFVDAEILIQTSSGETTEFQTNRSELGSIDQASGTRVMVRPRLHLEAGKWTVLCAIPIHGSSYTAVATIRLR